MICGVLWGVFWLDECDRINVGDVGNWGDGGDGGDGGDRADKVGWRLDKGSTRGPCGPKKQLHLLVLTKNTFPLHCQKCMLHALYNKKKVCQSKIVAFFGSNLCTQVNFGENVDVQDVTLLHANINKRPTVMMAASRFNLLRLLRLLAPLSLL